MSFRKRNVGLSAASATRGAVPSATTTTAAASGSIGSTSPNPSPLSHHSLRPSPIDGRMVTSTGTPTLDNLLAGHSGLALGHTILIGENGTTDFAGSLLRYYAAEGVVQEHKVHVVGPGEMWGKMLPGLIGSAEELEKGERRKGKKDGERMKIAWRYERFGEFGAGVGASRAPTDVEAVPESTSADEVPRVFCHAFDLTKRLMHPSLANISYYQVPPTDANPFLPILQKLTASIASSPPTTIHRIVIPGLLSVAFYPPHAALPQHVLQFLHGLRALCATYPDRVTAMLSLPLSLYPRSTALIRWAELLSDGVLELVPFPHSTDASPASTSATSGAATAGEEPPQGMFKVHKLPVFHERGGGPDQSALLEDLAFTLSRRRFTIKPFNLPPVEGDSEAQKGNAGPGETGAAEGGGEKMPSAKDLEF